MTLPRIQAEMTLRLQNGAFTCYHQIQGVTSLGPQLPTLVQAAVLPHSEGGHGREGELPLLITPGDFCLSKAKRHPSKYSWYSTAPRAPWHQMVTGLPFGTMKLGWAQMTGFQRVSGRESEAGVVGKVPSPTSAQQLAQHPNRIPGAQALAWPPAVAPRRILSLNPQE